MPEPDVYANSTVDPLLDIENIADANFPQRGILYATDWKPAETKDLFYENQDGFLVHLGLANIIAGKKQSRLGRELGFKTAIDLYNPRAESH